MNTKIQNTVVSTTKSIPALTALAEVKPIQLLFDFSTLQNTPSDCSSTVAKANGEIVDSTPPDAAKYDFFYRAIKDGWLPFMIDCAVARNLQDLSLNDILRNTEFVAACEEMVKNFPGKLPEECSVSSAIAHYKGEEEMGVGLIHWFANFQVNRIRKSLEMKHNRNFSYVWDQELIEDAIAQWFVVYGQLVKKFRFDRAIGRFEPFVYRFVNAHASYAIMGSVIQEEASFYTTELNDEKDNSSISDATTPASLIESPETPRLSFTETELMRKLQKTALENLKGKSLEIFQLCEIDGLTYRDAADKINCSISLISQALAAAKKKVFAKMREILAAESHLTVDELREELFAK